MRTLETGRPVAQVARDVGVNDGTLGNWVKAWCDANPEPATALSPIERVRVSDSGASSAPVGIGGGGIDASGLDEIREVVGADSHVSADSTEADSSLRDEPSHEASWSSQMVGYLVNCQQGTGIRRAWDVLVDVVFGCISALVRVLGHGFLRGVRR